MSGALGPFSRTPGRPPAHVDFLKSHDALVGKIPNEAERWRRRHNYYLNCLRDVDRNIGAVLAELDAAGLMDHTIIVLTADHGDMDGAHQLHAKGAVAYREQNNVPLVIRHPARKGGQLCQALTSHGDLAPTLPLRGIWAIEAMTVDGEAKPPSGSGVDRWRRVIIEAPTRVTVQRMDDSFLHYRAEIDMEASTLTLTRGGKPPDHVFTFAQPVATKLLLDGTLDGQRMHIETSLLDHRKFLLLTRGFHWIQEYPFNR